MGRGGLNLGQVGGAVVVGGCGTDFLALIFFFPFGAIVFCPDYSFQDEDRRKGSFIDKYN